MESNRNLLTTTVADDGTVSVAGDIDMAGGPILEEIMLAREAQLGISGDLVIDVEGVQFIDSSGLRSLLAAARRAGGRNARLELRAVGPEVIRLFEITGTLDQFNIVSLRD
jgi:anti-sigma B factor antagonist